MGKQYRTTGSDWSNERMHDTLLQEALYRIFEVDQKLQNTYEYIQRSNKYGDFYNNGYSNMYTTIQRELEHVSALIQYTYFIDSYIKDADHTFGKKLNKAIEEYSLIDLAKYTVPNTLNIKETVVVQDSPSGYGTTYAAGNMTYNSGTYGNSYTSKQSINTRTVEVKKSSINIVDISMKCDILGMKEQLQASILKSGVSKAELEAVTREAYEQYFTTSFAHKVDAGFLGCLSEVVDVIPIIGSVKNYIEAGVGYTMTGEKLTDAERRDLAIMATGFLLVDVFTLGLGASLAKGGAKLGAKAVGKIVVKEMVKDTVVGMGIKAAGKGLEEVGLPPELAFITMVAGSIAYSKYMKTTTALGRMNAEDYARYNKYWDDIASGAKTSPKIDLDAFRRQLITEGKWNELRALDANKLVVLDNGEIAFKSINGDLVRSLDYLDDAGNIKWPPYNGFELDELGKPIMSDIELKKGQIIDRYGDPSGTFTSPVENGIIPPYDTRGLPYPESFKDYYQYEVVKDVNLKNVQEGFDNLSPADFDKLRSDMIDYKFTLNDIANPQSGKISVVFGAGGGTQIKLGTSVSWYEKLGILKEIK